MKGDQVVIPVLRKKNAKWRGNMPFFGKTFFLVMLLYVCIYIYICKCICIFFS